MTISRPRFRRKAAVAFCILAALAVMASVAFAGTLVGQQSDQEKTFRLYDFDTARIEFNLTMGNATGTRLLVIADHGHYVYEKTTRHDSIGDIVTELVVRGDIAYAFSRDKKMGEKRRVPRETKSVNIDLLTNQFGSRQKALEALQKAKIVLLSNEDVLGFDCVVWGEDRDNNVLVKNWAYKDLVLKMEIRQLQGSDYPLVQTMTPVKAEFDIPVDKSLFEIPDGLTIVSMLPPDQNEK